MALSPSEWDTRRHRLTPWLWGLFFVGLVGSGWFAWYVTMQDLWILAPLFPLLLGVVALSLFQHGVLWAKAPWAKWARLGLVLLFVLANIFGWSLGREQRPAVKPLPTPTITQWPVYTSSQLGFTIRHPSSFSVNPDYIYAAMGPGRDVSGASFNIDPTLALGTNLSTDSYVSVERLVTSTACSPALFMDSAQSTSTLEEGGVTYQVAHGGGAGAGNYYDETVYVLPGAPCMAIRYFIHSTSIGNYEPGTIREFDRGSLVDLFDQIRRSYRQVVQLFYYNPQRDQDASGNVQCSSTGLAAVNRTVSSSADIIANTVRLLLQGQLTQIERSSGITTEFPLPGVTLERAELADGILSLIFSDPLNRTGGGSCRVGILWAQIKATAKQFPGVVEVKFLPEELFQP
jgi:hypothetical protein